MSITQLSVAYGTDTFQVDGTFDVADREWIEALLVAWQAARVGSEPPSAGPAVALRFTPFPLIQLGEEGRFMLLLTVTQQCGLALTPVDAKGNPAALDGVPRWTSSDETVATVAPATDGLTAVVKAVGIVGKAQINVVADAHIGPGMTQLSGALDVLVQAGEAVSLGITTDTPEEQPAGR